MFDLARFVSVLFSVKAGKFNNKRSRREGRCGKCVIPVCRALKVARVKFYLYRGRANAKRQGWQVAVQHDFFVRYCRIAREIGRGRQVAILLWHSANCGVHTYRNPSKPSSEPLTVNTGALAYAFATLLFLSRTITFAQISSSIWFHLSKTSWMWSCK